MCEPVSAIMALTAISGAMTIMGQQQAAKAQQAAANYNAEVAKNNATIAEKNVRQQQLEGMRQEEAQRLKTANLLGTQKSAFGASGVDLNVGSAVDVQASTAFYGQEDLLSIRAGVQAQEDRLHQQATDFTNQAQMSIAEGKNARRAANIQSVGTAIGTLTSMASFGQSQGLFSGADAGASTVTADDLKAGGIY